MPFPLSPQSIDAIADIISGGGGNDPEPSIGIYRSGPKIEKFMRACNVDFRINGSRVPSLINCLIEINEFLEAQIILTRIIEAAADPRDFINDPDKHIVVLDYLNRILCFDDFEVRQQGNKIRLFVIGNSTTVTSELADISGIINFDTVSLDLDRALSSCKDDPEDSVTSACSTVESVCRSILIELDVPLPAKKDIQNLYKAVKEPLGLSTDRSDLNQEIAADVRQILSGLNTTVSGIGALRTHGGDAHGRERGRVRIDARIARLSIHSASTISLFLIETWQRKYPDKILKKHNE